MGGVWPCPWEGSAPGFRGEAEWLVARGGGPGPNTDYLNMLNLSYNAIPSTSTPTLFVLPTPFHLISFQCWSKWWSQLIAKLIFSPLQDPLTIRAIWQTASISVRVLLLEPWALCSGHSWTQTQVNRPPAALTAHSLKATTSSLHFIDIYHMLQHRLLLNRLLLSLICTESL